MNKDYTKVKDALVVWLREWFDRNGANCNAVVGISGGKDSTVVAALCVEAIGKDRVIGVMMPNGEQKDINDAIELCGYLGIRNYTVNIKDTYDTLLSAIPQMDNGFSNQTLINLAPRLRMATLYAISQSNNGRVINTGNLSEKYIGYFTLYGDSAGDVAPISNLTKTEVVNVGIALGLPEHLVRKAPSDGLSGKTDEESIGFTYDELDKFLMNGKKYGETINEEVLAKIRNMHMKNLFKSRRMESFLFKPVTIE